MSEGQDVLTPTAAAENSCSGVTNRELQKTRERLQKARARLQTLDRLSCLEMHQVTIAGKARAVWFCSDVLNVLAAVNEGGQ